MATTKKTESKAQEKKTEAKKEQAVIKDIIVEKVEVIEKVEPATTVKQQVAVEAEDPLSDFKEKMIEEEMMTGNSPKKSFMWPILFIFVVAIILLIGIFAYKNGAFKAVSVKPTPTPEPAVVVKPTVVAVDLTEYKIEIKNGSGVGGEAARQKESLEDAGFVVSSVGNADNSDYIETIIKAKKDVSTDFIAKLKDVLSESFTVGASEELSSSSDASVIVILGAKK